MLCPVNPGFLVPLGSQLIISTHCVHQLLSSASLHLETLLWYSLEQPGLTSFIPVSLGSPFLIVGEFSVSKTVVSYILFVGLIGQLFLAGR